MKNKSFTFFANNIVSDDNNFILEDTLISLIDEGKLENKKIIITDHETQDGFYFYYERIGENLCFNIAKCDKNAIQFLENNEIKEQKIEDEDFAVRSHLFFIVYKNYIINTSMYASSFKKIPFYFYNLLSLEFDIFRRSDKLFFEKIAKYPIKSIQLNDISKDLDFNDNSDLKIIEEINSIDKQDFIKTSLNLELKIISKSRKMEIERSVINKSITDVVLQSIKDDDLPNYTLLLEGNQSVTNNEMVIKQCFPIDIDNNFLQVRSDIFDQLITYLSELLKGEEIV